MAVKYNGTNKAEILDQVEKRAYELLEKYRGCAQCTLLALLEAFDLQDDRVFKAASGLAGGIGGMRSACGALVGGSLVLGLKYGREVNDLKKSPEEAIDSALVASELVGKLYKWFEREFGSAICSNIRKSLIGVDLDTRIPWEKEMSEELGLHERCCELAGKTARKVAEVMIQDEK